MKGFRGHLAVYGIMLAVPVGRFMKTKTEQWKCKVTHTESELKCKVSHKDELRLRRG